MDKKIRTGRVLLALLDLEVDIAEGPDVVGGAFGGSVVRFANFEVWIFFAKNIRYPEATDVVGQSLCTD